MMFQPKIIAIVCNWCTYLAADTAGVSRLRYDPSVKIVRVMCSGRIDVQMVLWALHKGADGVLLGGCKLGDCHYKDGNYTTLRKYMLLKQLLIQLGIEEERVRLEWVSGSEAALFKNVVNEFAETIKELGPLRLREFNNKEKTVTSQVKQTSA